MNETRLTDSLETPMTDPDLHALRTLTPPLIDPAVSERTRLALHAEVRRQAALPPTPFWRTFGELYFRVEPALAAGIVLAFLTWTGSTVVMLLR